MATGDHSRNTQQMTAHVSGKTLLMKQSLSLSCDVVLLEMEGSELKKKPTLPESCFPSKIILGAILVLGKGVSVSVRMLGSS